MPPNKPVPPNPSSHESEPGRRQRYVGSAFRIGNPELTEETFERGERLLKWVPGEFDGRLAPLAGWHNLDHGTDEDGFGFIKVPAGTRSASSVLSGLEAWEGEKAEVLDFIAGYEKQVSNIFGRVDVSVSLDSVAVTKDRRLFVTPPHRVSDKTQDLADWFLSFVHDLNEVLVMDPNRQDLADRYFSQIKQIQPGGRKP